MASLLLLLPLLLFVCPLTSAHPRIRKEALPTKSGYLPITNGSAFYYAFYEAQQPISPLSDTPLLIWLAGGPGDSSFGSNFHLIGPYLITSSGTADGKEQKQLVLPNPNNWNRHVGIMFVDNPIGVGFSYTPNEGSADDPDQDWQNGQDIDLPLITGQPFFAINVKQDPDVPRDVATDGKQLFNGLQYFLSSNPAFRSRPLYICGSSYAGKFVPALGYAIIQGNPSLPQEKRVNLQGLVIGNGYADPTLQAPTMAECGYYMGLVSSKQRDELEKIQSDLVRLIREEKWLDAYNTRQHLISWFDEVTGVQTLDVRPDDPAAKPHVSVDVQDFLQDKEVALAFGGTKEGWLFRNEALLLLQEDITRSSVKYMVEGLLKEGVRTMLFQGVFDCQDGFTSTNAWVKELQWEGLKGFMEAERKVWRAKPEEVSGYVKRSGPLTQVVVLGASHVQLVDQGPNCRVMMEDWVQQKGVFAS